MHLFLVVVFLVFVPSNQLTLPQPAGNLQWESLERTSLFRANKNVGFSNTLEGTVSDPDLEVYVLVSPVGAQRWKPFPATVADEPNRSGTYTWRAIVNLGRLDGTGKGNKYTVQVVALKKDEQESRTRRRIPANALRSRNVVLKRVK